MSKRIYVSNLPFSATEDEIKDFFSSYATSEVRIILDRETQRPRGFAFVQLADPGKTEEAIYELNGRELGGRTIRVSEAHERPQRGGDRPKNHDRRQNHGGKNGDHRRTRDNDNFWRDDK